ncbi:Disease resistance RPP13-like protein 4 [Triticum urartu]|uniref:Disease resistance RPP13-like protein 4 n=1 Tax=Triticum urartu TaxID=4572 RepID=M7ZYJ4_TRIUA|nr:disease resistance protein PIK6-NP-like [Triticum urartu]EMS53189.1 Disease resistance RPP13-like protein 4 [Triticum urartu]
MEVAMLAIRPLLPKLGSLLAGEFTLEKRVRKGIDTLNRELKLMHAALGKVAKVPPDQLDEGVKIWAGMVRDLAYHMEDIVDTFMVRVYDGSSNPKNRVKKLLKKTGRLFSKGKDHHRISDALKQAVARAEQLAEQRQRYEVETPDTGPGISIGPRIKAMYTDVTELIGIEEPREELINMLLQGDDWSNNPLKTVSIVGFGGLGKTTLAKTVYDKIKVKFDCRAFVSVSQNPDIKKILKDILFGLDKDKYAKIYNVSREASHLIDELIEFLNDKRYLIIIDDIWDEESWEIIKLSFFKKSLGSRLITTTRNVNVAKACCTSTDDIYRMKPLCDDVSRRLFCKRVFSPSEGCPHELLEVSQHILKKCGGIPLAIITIASLLANNHRMKTKDHWDAVLNSIGRGLTEDRNVKEMKKILLFSYYDLPSYLKPCLLYLSIFPEDHLIMRRQLILKWISEGIVYSEEEETSLYELGDSYFNELVNRSMIQPIGIDEEEKVEACRVHDMVLDLICSLASEENFVTILNGTKRIIPDSQSKVRRLSIQNSNVEVATISMAQVRSISIFTNDNVDQPYKVSSCPVLRVSDLEYCPSPDTWNFLHLRLLRLKGHGVKELPMEIGKLLFLQVLDISETSIKEIPSSIVALGRLMYLHLGSGVKLPSGVGNLTSLEVLMGLTVGKTRGSSDSCNHHLVKELCNLTKLRVLHLYWGVLDESIAKTLVESLSNLHRLQVLEIFGGKGGHVNLMHDGWVPSQQLRRVFIMDCSFWTLPAWINPSSLPLLSYLVITLSKVRPEDIPLLGMLPALRHLSLSVDGYGSRPGLVVTEMEKSVVTADAFPCVEVCCFHGIVIAPSKFPRGAAPRLKGLHFWFPARWIVRGDNDLSMGHLPSLKEVWVCLLHRQASDEVVEEADAALRAAAEDHPNRPVIKINRI